MKKTVTIKTIRIENYKSFSNQLPGRKDFSCEFGHRTKISGRNREGKSTLKDAYFDTITGKLADGSQPDKVRPHDENGVDIDRVDIIREIGLRIDGKSVTVSKKTAQKWRKPRGQSEEVFDGNVTTYSIDGFEQKQKDFQKWQENIADPDVLLMCSNARPFLNAVQKSTAEARKILERMSGFKVEDFVAQNPEYALVDEITKGHSVEEAIKQARKNLSAQKKAVEKVRTELSYEKSRNTSGDIEVSDLELAIADLNRQLSDLDRQEAELDELIKAYDNKSNELLSLQSKLDQIKADANKDITEKRQAVKNEIAELTAQYKENENALSLAEMDLKHAGMGKDRYTDELKKARSNWKLQKESEFDTSELESEENETFDENTLICPKCRQILPKEQAEKLRSDFEDKKATRIKEIKAAMAEFEEAKQKKLEQITEDGNKAGEGFKKAEALETEAQKKIEAIKGVMTGISLRLQEKEKELSEIPEYIDVSDNKEYQQTKAEIATIKEELTRLSNGSEQRFAIRTKRNNILSDIADNKSAILKQQADAEEKERLVSELEAKLKDEVQKCADIEKNIDTLMNFSIKKNKALADKINTHFRHFKFSFLDYTIEGNPVETLRLVCDGTDYFGGLNGGDQRLVELDLCRGLQEINGLCLPIWLDEANAIDPERIPQDLEQQLICLERANCGLKVEVS